MLEEPVKRLCSRLLSACDEHTSTPVERNIRRLGERMIHRDEDGPRGASTPWYALPRTQLSVQDHDFYLHTVTNRLPDLHASRPRLA